MLTEELLAAAAAEVNEAMLRGLPEPEDCRPGFSDLFERRMKRVLRRGRHPAAYRLMQRAASVVLVLLIGFAAILAASPTVRACVWGWIREKSESWNIYRFEEPPVQETDRMAYELGRLPEGYTEYTRSDMPDAETIIYADADGTYLFFSYSKNPDAIKYHVKMDGYVVEEASVGGMGADVYTAVDPKDSSCIIWCDDTTNTIFYIAGYFDREELIELAQNVRRTDGEQVAEEVAGFVITALPEGYAEVLEVEEDGNYVASYTDAEGQVLHFFYGSGSVGSFYIEEEGYDITSATVRGEEADLYMAREASNSNGIIWCDEDSGMIFCISAYLDQEELIALAESVEPVR